MSSEPTPAPTPAPHDRPDETRRARQIDDDAGQHDDAPTGDGVNEAERRYGTDENPS